MVPPLLAIGAREDPIGMRVIESLGEGERCGCDLTSELALAQSKPSFHLRMLRDAGLISARQQGRWMYDRTAFSRQPCCCGFGAGWIN